MKRHILLYCSGLLVLAMISCQDFVQIDPPKDELSTPTVFSSDAVAESAIRGIYSTMHLQTSFAGGSGSTLSALQGIASDELMNDLSSYADHLENSLRSTDPYVSSNWTSLYHLIYLANSAMEGVKHSDALSAETAMRLEGEAKFFRAFCYFYLVNLWGEVPLLLSSDYRVNTAVLRASTDQVYQQIVSDLIDAQRLLPEDYSLSGGLRTRVNKWTATALLARTYLFMGDWNKAEFEATAVIGQETIFTLEPDLGDVFLVGSREAIFQFYPLGNDMNNSKEARLFLPSPFLLSLGVPPSYLTTDNLLAAFEADDKRRSSWVDSVLLNDVIYRYPGKYKIFRSDDQIEFTVLMRLAEQYLIRAEARAHLGRIIGSNSAESDVNTIRNRAGLGNTTASNESTVLDAIMHERRVELFSEWGHRWFDLVRTGRANTVLGSIKPDWTPEDMLRPIPQSELNLNPFLTQNLGY